MVNEKRLDLIDREKVYENACAGCTRHGENPGECYHDEPCERLIFAFTVAEPVEVLKVVHGRWETDCDPEECEKDFYCSVCEELLCDFDTTALYPGENCYYYCPNCGAKMDGDGSD